MVQSSGAKTKAARIVDHFAGDKNDQNSQDALTKKGPQRTLKHQNSVPEGQMANKVPITVSKQRLHGMKYTPTIKTGNLNCNSILKTKFMSLSPMGAPKSNIQIGHVNHKGQKTTVPNSNVTHQQDVFGGVCFSTCTDELNQVFEDGGLSSEARV